MEKYRKPNQYYLDYHHREIIAELRVLFKPVAEAFQEMQQAGEDKDNKHYFLDWKFREKAVELNRMKQKIILESMQADDRKDQLVDASPVPKRIRCNTCGKKMRFSSRMFDIDSTEIRFLFECKDGHLPKRAIYADGREYLVPQKKCRFCGDSKFSSSKEIKDNLLILTDECKSCGQQDILELDETPEDSTPINEQERKYFCTDFEHADTPLEGLTKFCRLIEDIVKHPKITYDVEVIKKQTIQQVEKRLKKKLKKENFKKFKLDKPIMGQTIAVAFSVLDATDRTPAASRAGLKKLIGKYLFKTNWRLMKSKITYRMGYLEGKLRGYENDFDLQMIAGEIHAEINLKKAKEEPALKTKENGGKPSGTTPV